MTENESSAVDDDEQADEGVARRRFLRTAAATAIALPAMAAMTSGRASAGAPSSNPPLSYISALEPYRCYDSRWTSQSVGPGPVLTFGRLSTGQTRAIAVWGSFSTAGTAATFTGSEMPVSTSILAVTYNLTVVNTLSSGFLMVGPGDSTPTSSHINWFGAGQVLANAGTVRIFPGPSGDTQTIEVKAGGPAGSSTHFIVDITGWFEVADSGPIIM